MIVLSVVPPPEAIQSSYRPLRSPRVIVAHEVSSPTAAVGYLTPAQHTAARMADEQPGAAAAAYVNPTPKGQLKTMDEPMAPAYVPHVVEAAWNDWWEESGYYVASSDPDDKRPKFSICLPPPNVTGSLHLGHALTVAVQDLLCRWKRMSGYNVMWIPGTDHAGIATQVVVEKKLAKEQKLTRHDLGREKFVEMVYEWKEQYGSRITTQLRRLGCSLDWSREVFTMDAPRGKSVTAAFIKFHQDGLIYRDVRLTNWCCQLRSGISDIEVDYIDIEARTRLPVPGHPKDRTYVFGVIWSFAYKLEGSDEEIVVATTRPETMLGDAAVAVHPDDPRYKQFHGCYLKHPFVERRVKLITDATLVDMGFGTGAVKVTPAHDPNDFACGRRHGLDEITVLTDEGQMAANCGEFSGMMRFEARIELLKRLKELGLYRGEATNKMRLGKCSRTGDVIEPMLKPQWWVDCSGMAKRATDAVRNGDLKIMPEDHEKTWFRWLDNIRDWCVSRQLWWGHRIPAYYVHVKGVAQKEPVVAASEAEARAQVVAATGCAPGDVALRQDEDVLDTWFSSGLFPFSPLGWPDEQSPDMKAGWHPTTLLETGHDILFFWVARMVMCSLHLTDKLPFTEVYLHAMVRDKYGRKMSKSLGNVIDPLEVISGVTLGALCAKLHAGNLAPAEVEKAEKMNHAEYPRGIPECGSDALRIGILAYCQSGRDVNLDISRVVGYSKFCNKLWNATRFAFRYIEAANPQGFRPAPLPCALTLVGDAAKAAELDLPFLPDAWILSRLAAAVDAINGHLGKYEIALSVQAVYDFWYNDLCCVYLEAIKPVMQLDSASIANAAAKHATQTVLHCCLHNGLRLLHPFMPFVTEELYQRLQLLAGEPRSSVMHAPYPKPEACALWRSARAEAAMGVVTKVAAAIRGLRGTYLKGALEKHAPPVYVVCKDKAVAATIAAQAETILILARSSKAPPPASLAVVADGCAPPRGCVTDQPDPSTEVHVLLKGVIDFGKEIERLRKDVKTKQTYLDKLKAKVGAKDYAARAPAATQEEDHKKIADTTDELASTAAAIKQLEEGLD